MQILPVIDPTFTSGIIPILGDMEDRGSILFDSKRGGNTASTIQKASTYCKDITGCGTSDYRSVSAAMTLNYQDNCTPKLNGVLSMSGLFFQSATTENVNDMVGVLLAPNGGRFGLAAASVCPEAPVN